MAEWPNAPSWKGGDSETRVPGFESQSSRHRSVTEWPKGGSLYLLDKYVLDKGDYVGSNPTTPTRINPGIAQSSGRPRNGVGDSKITFRGQCACDEIGKHTALRLQVLWVRVPPSVPE